MFKGTKWYCLRAKNEKINDVKLVIRRLFIFTQLFLLSNETYTFNLNHPRGLYKVK